MSDRIKSTREYLSLVPAIGKARPSMDLLDGPALAQPLPPLDYLVEQLGLSAGSGAPHLLAGYGFSGKTVAAQSLALALVAGRCVWGAFSSKARRVIHIDLEQGDRLTRRRYQRLAVAMGVALPPLDDHLVVAIYPEIRLVGRYIEEWKTIMEGRDLLIVDSLRAATAGVDENDSAIREGLDMLGKASESTGCRSLVIHHARKPVLDESGGRCSVRGSSAIFDACDSVHVFSAGKDEPVRVEHVKARSHGELTDDLALVIGDVDLDGDPRAGLRVHVHGAEVIAQRRDERQAAVRRGQAQRNAETVRRVLTTTPGLGGRELREATSLSGSKLAEALAALGSDLDVRETRDARGKTVRHYIRVSG